MVVWYKLCVVLGKSQRIQITRNWGMVASAMGALVGLVWIGGELL